MEEKKTATPEFPINQHLLEEATKIKEQWRIIRDRLDKIETSRAEVSPAVYERVRDDYHNRLQEVTKQLMDKKQDIDSELESLYATRTKIADQLEEQRQALEEVRFRNTLGEFTDEEYRKQGRERQDTINKFETAMNAVTANISRYESIFHEEAELLGVEAATPHLTRAEEAGEEELPDEEISEVQKFAPRGARTLETDEEGYIINETEAPDYFAAADSTGETDLGKPAVEESQTIRTSKESPKEPKKVMPRARVIIISGDQAGAAYPLKDTVTLGRADSNTIVLKDAKTSRQHAQIQQHGNQFILVDLNSSNGTYVNGQRIEEHVLQNNDEIQIGDYILQFQE